MRKVKIICTIGPASNSRRVINRMIRAGMDVARLNFSHGTHGEHRKAFELIKEEAYKNNSPVAVLQDLRGLKIRVGSVKNGAVLLKKNSVLTLTAKKIESDEGRLSIPYPYLIKDAAVGKEILLDDGLLRLRVIERKKDSLSARVIEGGILREKKGVNLPGAKISGEIFTDKDKDDLEFGMKMGVDYVAMSFV